MNWENEFDAHASSLMRSARLKRKSEDAPDTSVAALSRVAQVVPFAIWIFRSFWRSSILAHILSISHLHFSKYASVGLCRVRSHSS